MQVHQLHCIWDLYQQVDLIWDVRNRFLLHGRCSRYPVVLYNIDLMAVTWSSGEGVKGSRWSGRLSSMSCCSSSAFDWWSWNLSRWRCSWALLILGLGEEQAGVHVYGQIFINHDLLHQVTMDTEELEQGSWACFSYRPRRWARDRDHSPEGSLCTGLKKTQTPVEVCLLFQSPSCRKAFLFWTRQRFVSLVVHQLRFGWIVICLHELRASS